MSITYTTEISKCRKHLYFKAKSLQVTLRDSNPCRGLERAASVPVIPASPILAIGMVAMVKRAVMIERVERDVGTMALILNPTPFLVRYT